MERKHMDGLTLSPRRTPGQADALPAPSRLRADERGVSLLEILVSMLLLTGALLGLGQAFALGLLHASSSSPNLIAREKAREAVESVHTARDTRTIRWAQIRNVTPRMCPDVPEPPGWNSEPGVFIDGPQEGGLHMPGDDGMVNTAGDENEPLERVVNLGPDGILGTDDDWEQELTQFTREIWVCDHSNSLREIRVSVRYRIGGTDRTYRLTTYVSNYS